MAIQKVTAKYAVKDTNGNSVMIDGPEGPEASVIECSVDYDFGADLNSAIEMAGAEAVFSNYVANAKVALQGIIRAKLKAGNTPEQIQAVAASWKPGMVAEKTVVDPVAAVKAAFATWTPEQKTAYLKELGVM